MEIRRLLLVTILVAAVLAPAVEAHRNYPSAFLRGREDPEAVVDQLFRGVLGRPARHEELHEWGEVIERGSRPFFVVQKLLDGPEFARRMSNETFVIYVFWRFLDRDPRPQEYRVFRDYLREGGSRAEVVRSVLLSREFRARGLPAPLLNGWSFFEFDPAQYEGYDLAVKRLERAAPEPVHDGDHPLVQLLRPMEVTRAQQPLRGELEFVSSEPLDSNYQYYCGYLHAHSYFSDDAAQGGHPSEAYDMARYDAGMDFMGITDHGEYLLPWEWDELRATADEYNDEGSFVAMAGFEYSHFLDGHLCVVGTSTYTSFFVSTNLDLFYAWLNQHPEAIATFNHPGSYDYIGTEFHHFEYNPSVDPMIVGIEVIQNGGFDDYAVGYGGALSFFAEANLYGWHVGALSAQDNHSMDYGIKNDVRTIVLADELTRASLMDAYRAHRFYASEDRNLRLVFRGNDQEMGAELPAGPVVFTVSLSDPDGEYFTLIRAFRDGEAIYEREIYAQEGTWRFSVGTEEDHHFYHIWVEQEDGDAAHSSPIWVSGTNPGPPPTPPPSGCLFRTAARGTALEGQLQPLYGLRDRLEEQGPEGRRLVARFYAASPELTRIISGNPELLAELRGLTSRAIELLSDPAARIEARDIARVEAFAARLTPQASSSLRQEIGRFLELLRGLEGRPVAPGDPVLQLP
jgi:hypothetical protein